MTVMELRIIIMHTCVTSRALLSSRLTANSLQVQTFILRAFTYFICVQHKFNILQHQAGFTSPQISSFKIEMWRCEKLCFQETVTVVITFTVNAHTYTATVFVFQQSKICCLNLPELCELVEFSQFCRNLPQFFLSSPFILFVNSTSNDNAQPAININDSLLL